MKQTVIALLMLGMAVPAFAMPGDGPMGPGPGPQPGPAPGAFFDRLPLGVETVLIAGLTYYVLNGVYYQRDHDRYVVVNAPPAPDNGMTVLDVNGERYYVRDGHYYRRTINGDYIEAPKPAGL